MKLLEKIKVVLATLTMTSLVLVSFSCLNKENAEKAAQAAEDSLKYSSKSRAGLINQLVAEGYSKKEAEYGADNCGADWNENAAGTANDYLKFRPFSRAGLVKQLIYEGYSKEEAEYGAGKCEADWNNNAAIKAREFMEFEGYLSVKLRDELKSIGYSKEEAEYGAALAEKERVAAAGNTDFDPGKLLGKLADKLENTGLTDALSSPKTSGSLTPSQMLKSYEELVVALEQAATKKNVKTFVNLSAKAVSTAQKLEKVKGELSSNEVMQLSHLTARFAAATAKLAGEESSELNVISDTLGTLRKWRF